MSTTFKISIIGSGNVAYHLTHHLISKGHHINSIYTRQAKTWMDDLASIPHKSDLDYSNEYSDFIIIAIKDKAVEEVLSKMENTSNAQIIHTSGTLGLDVFEKFKFEDYGILYPFQTIQRSRPIDMSSVNHMIEARDKINLEKLEMLCNSADLKFELVDSENRAKYHLAAIFASNFLNHLLTISKEILDKENLDFDVLKPLINETVNKALALQPRYTQTGPAIREDKKIMDKHVEMLGDRDDLIKIYRLMSENIIQSFKH